MNKPLLDEAAHAPSTSLPRLHRGRDFWADVHIATSPNDIQRVLNHRYGIYARERGIAYPGLDHVAETLRDAEDADALLLYTTARDDRITSSLRFEFKRVAEIRDAAATSLIWNSRFCTGYDCAIRLSRMCGSPARQTNLYLFRMMLYAYVLALRNGAYFSYLRTLPATQPLYERLGYREISISEDGLRWMGLELLDHTHLKKVNSPLASIFSVFGPLAAASFGRIG